MILPIKLMGFVRITRQGSYAVKTALMERHHIGQLSLIRMIRILVKETRRVWKPLGEKIPLFAEVSTFCSLPARPWLEFPLIQLKSRSKEKNAPAKTKDSLQNYVMITRSASSAAVD